MRNIYILKNFLALCVPEKVALKQRTLRSNGEEAIHIQFRRKHRKHFLKRGVVRRKKIYFDLESLEEKIGRD